MRKNWKEFPLGIRLRDGVVRMRRKIQRCSPLVYIPDDLKAKLNRCFANKGEKYSPAKIMTVFGCSRQAARALADSRKLPKLLVDEMQRNVAHDDKNILRLRMQNILAGRWSGIQSLLTRLTYLAKMVQDYEELFPVSAHLKYYWHLSPRLEIRNISLALEEAKKLLVQLHDECPEFDKIVFLQAPELYAQITKPERVAERRAAEARRAERRRKALEHETLDAQTSSPDSQSKAGEESTNIEVNEHEDHQADG